VTLAIFDASGSLVRRFSQSSQPAGQHSIEWDGRDDAGTSLPAGIYLVRQETIDGVTSGKVALAP
jgi:flagellar basal-body rod modification protein FlgD